MRGKRARPPPGNSAISASRIAGIALPAPAVHADQPFAGRAARDRLITIAATSPRLPLSCRAVGYAETGLLGCRSSLHRRKSILRLLGIMAGQSLIGITGVEADGWRSTMVMKRPGDRGELTPNAGCVRQSRHEVRPHPCTVQRRCGVTTPVAWLTCLAAARPVMPSRSPR